MQTTLIQIFAIFFKMGASTFGGGYAMIPIIEKEMLENNKLISSDEFMDCLSVAQSFPGPIAVNIALLIGYKLLGTLGSIFALVGVVAPSFISILIAGYFYSRFQNSHIVRGFFGGVSSVVPALLLISFISVFKKLDKNYLMYILMIGTFIGVFVFKINPLFAIFIGGAIGLCL